MTDGRIDVEVEGGVAWITISNPARANCLTFEMINSLAECWERADADDAVRVAVLRGAGERHFCGGADRSMITSSTPAFAPGSRHNQTAMTLGFSKPVIGMINGPAIGLGMNLAIDCDIRVAAAHAYLADPRTAFGLPPNAALAMIAEASSAEAARLSLAGSKLDAERAFTIGLVTDIAADAAELTRIAGDYAAAIAERPPDAVAANVDLMRRLRRGPHMAEVMSAADRRADEVRAASAAQNQEGRTS